MSNIKNSISHELAEAAGIKLEQAEKVLEILHFDQLCVNFENMKHLVADSRSLRALNLSDVDVNNLERDISEDSFRLRNLRLGLNVSVSGLSVVA